MKMKQIFLLCFLAIFIRLNADAQNPNEYSFKKSWPIASPAQIAVKTNDGFIRVNPGQSDQIEVFFIVTKNNKLTDMDLNELSEEMNVEISNGRDYFDITISQKDMKRIINWKDRYHVSLHINAPQNSSCTLQTSDGNISLNDINGEQYCKTSDGDISAEDIKGKLAAFTSDGNIHIENITGSTELRTSDGDINAENIMGNVNCKTSDGNINMEHIQGDVEAVTSDGDVFMDHVTGNNSAQTSDGNIMFENMSGGLSARTSDGDIRGDFSKLTDDLYLKTSDGNISATIPDGQGIDLALKGEDIHAVLDDFSGETSDHRINGQIRGGGVNVDLSTSDGNVNLEFE